MAADALDAQGVVLCEVAAEGMLGELAHQPLGQLVWRLVRMLCVPPRTHRWVGCGKSTGVGLAFRREVSSTVQVVNEGIAARQVRVQIAPGVLRASLHQ